MTNKEKVAKVGGFITGFLIGIFLITALLEGFAK